MIEIWGLYNGNWEYIDCADNEQESDYMISEYMMAFGSDWCFEKR